MAGFSVILMVVFFKVGELVMFCLGSWLGSLGLSQARARRLNLIPGLTLILVGAWQVLT